MKLFENSKEQKDLLDRVSSLCGIKRSSVQKVWEYTIYALLMQIYENKEAAYNVLPVPFVGKILLKESKENPKEYDTFLMVYDFLKEEIKKVKDDDARDLISFFDEAFLSKTVNDLSA